MRAVIIENNEVNFKETEVPVIKENQMLVEVISAGINGADLLQKKGGYPAPKPWPQHIPGLELSGKVKYIGSAVEDFQVGDFIMSIVGGGAQAELAVAEPEYSIKLPAGLNPIKAGGFCETFFTAFDALIIRGKLNPGDEVLIVGAQGGVGTAGIQIAHAYGCRVTALTKNFDFKTRLTEIGANQVITDIGENKYDVILDLISGKGLSDRISNLKTEGRYVVIGVGAGFKAELNLLKLMEKRAVLTGATLRSRTKFEKQLVAEQIKRSLLKFIEEGKIDVIVHKTYSFTNAYQAYSDFENGGKLGKLILVNEKYSDAGRLNDN
jgi:NADPH:quinone reductase-like Zn-dependent oxidoreductase